MKKTVLLAWILLIAMLFLMSGCLSNDDSVPKEEIFAYVKENQELLESFPYDEFKQKLDERREDDEWNTEERKLCVEYFGKDTIIKSIYRSPFESDAPIDFYCGGSGLAIGNSTYCGFYYSEIGVYSDPTEPEFNEISTGVFEWRSEHWIVRHEHIVDNWYYYHEEFFDAPIE